MIGHDTFQEMHRIAKNAPEIVFKDRSYFLDQLEQRRPEIVPMFSNQKTAFLIYLAGGNFIVYPCMRTSFLKTWRIMGTYIDVSDKRVESFTKLQ